MVGSLGISLKCQFISDLFSEWYLQVTNVLVEVVEGDARNVLCESVDKHQAAMLVMGSHGYGAIKRLVFPLLHAYSRRNLES